MRSLQNPFTDLLTISKMGHPGLEPGANRLKAEYSTIELVTLVAAKLRHLSK
jgi:hypothetical protein